MAPQILTRKEAAALRTNGFGKKHPVRQMIETLKPGEILRVQRSEFDWKKRTPNYFCIRVGRASNSTFKVSNEVGRTGWLIERLT